MSPDGNRRAGCRALIATLIKVGSILLTFGWCVYKGQSCSWGWSPVNEVCWGGGVAAARCCFSDVSFPLTSAHYRAWEEVTVAPRPPWSDSLPCILHPAFPSNMALSQIQGDAGESWKKKSDKMRGRRQEKWGYRWSKGRSHTWAKGLINKRP